MYTRDGDELSSFEEILESCSLIKSESHYTWGGYYITEVELTKRWLWVAVCSILAVTTWLYLRYASLSEQTSAAADFRSELVAPNDSVDKLRARISEIARSRAEKGEKNPAHIDIQIDANSGATVILGEPVK